MQRYNPVTNLMEEVKAKDAGNAMVHIKFKKKNKKTGNVIERSGWYNSEQSFLKEEGANSAFEIVDYTVSGKAKDANGLQVTVNSYKEEIAKLEKEAVNPARPEASRQRIKETIAKKKQELAKYEAAVKGKDSTTDAFGVNDIVKAFESGDTKKAASMLKELEAKYMNDKTIMQTINKIKSIYMKDSAPEVYNPVTCIMEKKL